LRDRETSQRGRLQAIAATSSLYLAQLAEQCFGWRDAYCLAWRACQCVPYR
jgi:hypothetical protein